jgi:hypothetical protein
MPTKKPELNAVKPKYEPTSQEQAAIARHRARQSASLTPRLTVLTKREGVTVSPDHPDEFVGSVLLGDAFGTADPDFLAGIVEQLATTSTPGHQFDQRRLNFMASIVTGIKPRDAIEAMLAAQMAEVHIAIMRSARQLADAANIPLHDSAERAFNKLTRTFATQMEALKRYRTGGGQTVTVQQVSVSEGGQAIVGNVTQAPRAAPTEPATSPLALPDSQTPAMTILGDESAAMPVPLKRDASK